MTRLAHDNDSFTRKQIALAVDEAATLDQPGIYQLLDKWASPKNQKLHWTAMYALLTGQFISRNNQNSRLEWHRRLERLMQASPLAFVNVLYEVVLNDAEGPTAIAAHLSWLTSPPPDGIRNWLISAMSQALFEDPRSVFKLIGQWQSADDPNLSLLPVDVLGAAAETSPQLFVELFIESRWKQDLTADTDSHEDSASAIDFATVLKLFEPLIAHPETGKRSQILEVFAEAYQISPESTEAFLYQMGSVSQQLRIFQADVEQEILSPYIELLDSDAMTFLQQRIRDYDNEDHAGAVSKVIDYLWDKKNSEKKSAFILAFAKLIQERPNLAKSLLAQIEHQSPRFAKSLRPEIQVCLQSRLGQLMKENQLVFVRTLKQMLDSVERTGMFRDIILKEIKTYAARSRMDKLVLALIETEKVDPSTAQAVVSRLIRFKVFHTLRRKVEAKTRSVNDADANSTPAEVTRIEIELPHADKMIPTLAAQANDRATMQQTKQPTDPRSLMDESSLLQDQVPAPSKFSIDKSKILNSRTNRRPSVNIKGTARPARSIHQSNTVFMIVFIVVVVLVLIAIAQLR